MKTKEDYYVCECFEEALQLYYDKDTEDLYVSKWAYDGGFELWWILKNKVRKFFQVLFGKSDIGQSVVLLEKSKVAQMLKDLKQMTGYKPKNLSKKTGLFATYFYGGDSFDVLAVEPIPEEEVFCVWMCKQDVFWNKKGRWIKAWRKLKKGFWNKNSTFLDIDEVKEFMDYLNTMLKIDWEGYKNEESKEKAN